MGESRSFRPQVVVSNKILLSYRGLIKGIHLFIHCNNVLRRDFSKNIMHLVKHVASAFHEYIGILPHLFTKFLRVLVRKNPLSINATSPEDDIFPKLFFKLFGFHTPCRDLNRVYNIHTCLYQVRDKLSYCAAAMQKNIYIGFFFY